MTFQYSHNPLHRSIFDSMTDTSLTNYRRGRERVAERAGRFALVMESTAAEYLKSQDCGLYTVGHLEDRHYAFGFKKSKKGTNGTDLDPK